ncbi:hypothetical protein HYX17_01785 [Candidatus Woesearchaeota archaeon]|nr:hypothetical protein [Candidatus Woesearchaeota archaeon]
MENSKKTTIRICTRPCDVLLARLIRLRHIFIIDEYNNIYEFSRNIKGTKELTKWYLENNPDKINVKKINVNRKLFYRVVRIQRRIIKRKEYDIMNYNCHTYVNSILINLNKF